MSAQIQGQIVIHQFLTQKALPDRLFYSIEGKQRVLGSVDMDVLYYISTVFPKPILINIPRPGLFP